MSSNTQNTIQTGAGASGSDNESISSLSSRTANLNFGGSSSPAPASSEASDEVGDITIVKGFEIPPEGPNEDGEIPFLDKSGKPVGESTQPENFASWPEYLVYCRQGPKIKIRLAVVDAEGEKVGFRKVDYPKKLLYDQSEYFRALYRSGRNMREFEVGHLDLTDIDIVDFERLVMVITSGHPGSRHNIGPTERTLGDLLQTSALCDRFIMNQVRGWVATMMNEYLQEMSAWSVKYHHEVIARPNAGLERQHRAMALDVCDAYGQSLQMEPEKLPIQPKRYVSFLITSCPRVLLASVMEEFSENLILALTREMLVPTA
ncbi:hypothetical protein Daus18300_009155 [Diaporthe australafricana]|uniref:BTB domain-containing protein n=1 Tax=Diaporthe australafricana TaxID=127596 RepID=A0ABR3WF88_9PEZI